MSELSYNGTSKMNDRIKTAFERWRSENPHYKVAEETNILIHQWVEACLVLGRSLDIYYDTGEYWLKDHAKPVPDMVKLVANYGYSRIITGNWTRMPIDIPADELPEWEKAGSLPPTLEGVRSYQAEIAGTFMEMLNDDAEAVVKLIKQQLEERYDQLRRLAAQPLEAFTPRQWSEEAANEEEWFREAEKLDQLFVEYEELWCFESGIEELRMLTITEEDERFLLPNPTYFDLLVSLDGPRLMRELASTEPVLKKVLRHLANQRMSYDDGQTYLADDKAAPDAFWWRHWIASQSQNRNSNTSSTSSRRDRPGKTSKPKR